MAAPRRAGRSPSTAAADPMPESVAPMLAVLADKPFSHPAWVFELKWDGYRALVFTRGDRIRIASRNNLDLGAQFPAIIEISGDVVADSAIIDGEIVALDEHGQPDFQLLQNASGIPAGRWHQPISERVGYLVYYAFDLLYLNGRDLRSLPLVERKELLRGVARPGGRMRYSDHVPEHGELLFGEAVRSGLEGIVAKKADSRYVSTRSSDWQKIKTVRRQEVVIGGFTRPRGARQHFGALIVGVYENGELAPAGQVGGGFDGAKLKQISEALAPLVTDKCPFREKPPTNEAPTWVRPELVCEVKFAGWTDAGTLRQPVFVGMRTDKSAAQVTRERPLLAAPAADSSAVPPSPPRLRKAVLSAEEAFGEMKLSGDVVVDIDGHEVRLSNTDKLYWPDDGLTKADMLRYYYTVSDTILPYLADRPLILRRHPAGVVGESFYQHNVESAPEFVRTHCEVEDGEAVNYVIADSRAALVWIANLGVVAQNPFSSRVERLENPDYIVFDLDPNEAPYDTVCEIALLMRSVLEEAGLRAYAKASGSEGIHLYLPLKPIYSHAQAYAFGEIAANVAVARRPDIATVERIVRSRGKGRVYIDYMQNVRGKTVTSAYSVRAVPGAQVSAPLEWSEVASCVPMRQFTIATMPQRIAEAGDLFEPVMHDRQALGPAIKKIEKMLRKRL